MISSPVTVDPLPLKQADQRTDSLLARYRSSPSLSPEHLPLRPDVRKMVAEMATLYGVSAHQALAEMLCIHAHGWLLWDALRGDPDTPSTYGRAGPTVAQIEDMEALAHATGKSLPDYADTALRTALLGPLGNTGLAALRRPEWRAGTEQVSMKINMTERLSTAVGVIALHRGISASDVVRNLLLGHMIGRLGYAKAVREGLWAEYKRDPDLQVEIRFSRKEQRNRSQPEETPMASRTQRVREVGKAGEGFRLFCSPGMRRTVDERGAVERLPASYLCRRILLEAVFGRELTFPTPAELSRALVGNFISEKI